DDPESVPKAEEKRKDQSHFSGGDSVHCEAPLRHERIASSTLAYAGIFCADVLTYRNLDV
ncbi:MAG TPA: hypothetical protein VEU95_06620, partial [Micropepsaceae bacterium]|nr:hypothetical protein [Micropepsaceae bacterium]